jgi:hypothetical protein
MQNLVLSSPFGRLSCIECWSRCIACEGDTNKHRPVLLTLRVPSSTVSSVHLFQMHSPCSSEESLPCRDSRSSMDQKRGSEDRS